MKEYSASEIEDMKQFISETEQVPGYTYVNLDKNIGRSMFKIEGPSSCTGGELAMNETISLLKNKGKKQ